MNQHLLLSIFFSLYVFGEPGFISHNFLLCHPSRGQPAIPGGNSPEDWQSTVGWGDAVFEPRTAGQQSDALPLSHHASPSWHFTSAIHKV
jgi:hypothetical protein